MFENPRRGRQTRNFTTNAPKILDLKSSSEQIFSRKLPLGAPETRPRFRFFTRTSLVAGLALFLCAFTRATLVVCAVERTNPPSQTVPSFKQWKPLEEEKHRLALLRYHGKLWRSWNMCISWNPHPIATKRNTFNYDMEIGLYRDDGLAVQDLSLICICKPKSFPPVS